MSTTVQRPIYREELPPNCPVLEETAPLFPQKLLRLVGPEPLADSDFDSHAIHGPCTLKGRECDWAACSMYLDGTDRSILTGLRKFPRLKRKNAVAIVLVDGASGVARIDDTRHVAFWMYASFSPVDKTENVVALNEYRGSNDRD